MPNPVNHWQGTDTPHASAPAPSNENTAKHTIANGLHSAFSNRNILFTIPVFLVASLRYTTLNVLIQYASVRFGSKVSSGANFYSETAIVNVFLFFFLIPRMTDFIRTKYDVRPQVIDLALARISVSLLFTGVLCIGLSPSTVLLPIGEFVLNDLF